jgi:hypothetical protein
VATQVEESWWRPAEAAHDGNRRQANQLAAEPRALVNPALKVRNDMRGLPRRRLAPEHPLLRATEALSHRAY